MEMRIYKTSDSMNYSKGDFHRIDEIERDYQEEFKPFKIDKKKSKLPDGTPFYIFMIEIKSIKDIIKLTNKFGCPMIVLSKNELEIYDECRE